MNIFTQLPLIMNDVSCVKKDKSGQGLNYKYRGIDDFMNALNPVMAKHGVSLSSKILDRKSEIFEINKTYNGQVQVQKWINVVLHVEYTFYAQDGSSLKFETIGEGRDNSDKAHNKAMSSALKYCLMQAFLVPTEDIIDQDSERPEIVESKPIRQQIEPIRQEAPIFDTSEPFIDDKKEITKKSDVVIKNHADKINLETLGNFKFKVGVYLNKQIKDIQVLELRKYMVKLEKVKESGNQDVYLTEMYDKVKNYLMYYDLVNK